MLKFISIISFSLIFTLNILSQSSKESAPVIWQKYQIPEKQISVMLPKMPLVSESVDICNEIETKTYWAYAEEVVYQVKISSKYKKADRGSCEDKRNFSEKNFTDRISEIKRNSESTNEITFVQNKREVTKIKDKLFNYWFFNDFENDKWVELGITHRADVKPNEERFIKSLEFTENPTGIIIGVGAKQILGDEIAENEKKVSKNSDSNSAARNTEAILIITKPRPNYTDLARQNRIQGTITLNVTFLSNGGVGDIIPEKELPDGLTEETIAAVKKIVFLPQKVNGVKVTAAKQLKYSFSIY